MSKVERKNCHIQNQYFSLLAMNSVNDSTIMECEVRMLLTIQKKDSFDYQLHLFFRSSNFGALPYKEIIL